MAVYTPRGLKIRFSVKDAFTLMARLFPEISPFKVLKKAEAIEGVPDALIVIEAVIIIFLFPDASPLEMCAAIMGLYFIGYIMKISGVFFIPLVVPMSGLFSYIHGFGIITIALGIAGFIQMGLLKTAFLLGILLATNIFDFLLEMVRTIIYKATGMHYLTVSELDFLNAYKMLAASIDANIDTYVSEAEINEGNWIEPYHWLQYNYPEVAMRMPVNYMDYVSLHDRA